MTSVSAGFMKDMREKQFYTLMGVSMLVRSELAREKNSAMPDMKKIIDMEMWLDKEEAVNR